MSDKYLKQFEEFIWVYEKLFHLKSNEITEEAFNMITSFLISEYKTHISDLILSIIVSIKFNYRSIEIYTSMLNQIFSNFSIKELNSEYIFNTAESLKMTLGKKDDIYQISYDQNSFPKDNEISYLIMNDQVDKFIGYIINKPLKDTWLEIPSFSKMSPIEACAYF